MVEDYRYQGAELGKVWKDTSHFERKVPIAGKGHNVHRFSFQSVEIFFPLRFDAWFTAVGFSALATTIMVKYPATELDVDVWVSTNENPIKRGGEDWTEWQIARPLLPGQSFVAQWSPKKRVAPPPPSVGVGG
jgi:hypothetical protein